MFRFDASLGDLVQPTETESFDGETKASEVTVDLYWRTAGGCLPPNMLALFRSLTRCKHHKVTYSNLKEAREEVAEVCGPLSSRDKIVEHFVERGQLETASALKRMFQRVIRADTKLGFHLEVYKAILEVLNEESYPAIATFFMVTHCLEMADASVPKFRGRQSSGHTTTGKTIRSVTGLEKACPLLEDMGPNVNLTKFMQLLESNDTVGTVDVIRQTGPGVGDTCGVSDAGDALVSDSMAIITKIPDVHGHIKSMAIETKDGAHSIQVYAHDFPIFVPVNCVFRLKTSYQNVIMKGTEVDGYHYFGCSIIPEGDTFSLGNLRYTSIESPGSTATGASRAMSIENIVHSTSFATKCILKEFRRRIKSPTDVCWMYKGTFSPIPDGLVKTIKSFDDSTFTGIIGR